MKAKKGCEIGQVVRIQQILVIKREELLKSRCD
jgi:hypothetical protein